MLHKRPKPQKRHKPPPPDDDEMPSGVSAESFLSRDKLLEIMLFFYRMYGHSTNVDLDCNQGIVIVGTPICNFALKNIFCFSFEMQLLLPQAALKLQESLAPPATGCVDLYTNGNFPILKTTRRYFVSQKMLEFM